MEVGVQAYTGFYTVYSSQIRANGAGPLIRPAGTLETGNRRGIIDERIAGTFVWYPQPFGFQTEWNVGRGPGLNDAQNAVIERPLTGGYAMVMYKHDTCNHGILIPFVRWQYFEGGYRSERNAPYVHVDEWEAGLEWQINPSIEIVTMYTLTDRTNTTAFTDAGVRSYNQFEGQLLRVQLQWNY
jgi:Phosphate-selective porin O and P